MDFKELIPIFLSLIAIVVAFWQGFLAKAQLEQAKETKSETEKLLQDVKDKVIRIESISDETRKDVKEQIGKLIDKQDENFKVLLSAPQQNNQNEMIMQLLPQILANPDSLKTIIELSKK